MLNATAFAAPGAAGRHGESMASRTVGVDPRGSFLSTDCTVFAVHKRTGYQRYINTARRMASRFLTLIPDDGIVPWSGQL
jgi:hypothetical protein